MTLDGDSQEILKEKLPSLICVPMQSPFETLIKKAVALTKPKQLEFMSILAKFTEERSNLIEWDFDGSRIRANFCQHQQHGKHDC